MRKKYLSALLFGALLFASAGTFTSCKDYDDDINNLQEQINTVVSDLASLKTTVESLGGYVTDVKIEDGKLLVTVDNNTITYDLPTAAEVDKTTVTLDGQNLVVDGEVIGKVGDTVTVNEDGYLCVNGEATEIKAGKYAILENDADGVYTITLPNANGELQTIELAKASSAISLLTTEDNTTFCAVKKTTISKTDGINWGIASKDIDWKGPKGAVVKGDLLVGQINEVPVTVRPVSYDLGAQKLEFVDSEGNIAKATVVATSAGSDGPIVGGSRAADSQGKWNLSIAMTDEVTPDNMGSVFANEGNTKNLCYALRVNGSIVSDYVFEINTDKEDNSADYKKDWTTIYLGDTPGSGSTTSTYTMPLGTSEVTVKDASAYDIHVSITSKDQNDAEKIGVSIENNKITALPTAAGQTIEFDVVVLDVNGNEQKFASTMAVTFGTTEAGEAVTLEEVPYVVSAEEAHENTKSMIVNLGETFSSLTASEAVAFSNATLALSDDSEDKFVVAKANIGNMGISYYSDAECKEENKINPSDAEANIKNIKYAKLTYSTIQNNAEVGKYTLVLTLSTNQGASKGELKKVNIPVSVSIPTFDELFTKSGSWNEAGDAVTLKLANTNPASVDFLGTLSSSTVNIATDASANKFSIAFEKVDGKDVGVTLNNSGSLEVDNTNIMDEGAYVPLTATALTYNLGGKLDVKSGKFTVNLKSLIDGATVKNYADGAEAGLKITSASGTICAFVAGSGSTKDAGLALVVNDKKYALNASDVNGLNLTSAVSITAKFDAKAGSSAKAEVSNGTIQYSNVNSGTYTTVLTITITENNTGIVTTTTIPVSVSF